MIFGFVVQPIMLVTGGTLLIILLALQILVGMRKIRFQGRTHLKVHKWGAWVLLGLAIGHGILGYAYVLGLKI